MKILTWNIYKRNKNIQKAIMFLKKQEADIVCLQEFPVQHIELLKSLNPYIAIYEEVLIYKNNRKPDERSYSIIASKFPIQQQTVIAHKSSYGHINRYKHFQSDSFYVDVDTPEGQFFRIFNTHFKCITGPNHRLAQFKEVVGHLSADRRNIICGDFNTFGKPLLNLVLWKYLGYKAREITVNENKKMARLFDVHSLKNPLKRQVTFWKFPIQLDYILIPSYIEVKNKRVFKHPHGSDHFPLLLEI